jgi:MAF protein
MHRLILASQSPRRSELLVRAGFEFSITSLQISEIPDENLNLMEQIRDLAHRKALACLESGKLPKQKGILVLSADTVVVLDGQILGKPEDPQENKRFLRRLSGREHEVITAVCLVEVDCGKPVRFDVDHDQARIWFRSLSEQEIDTYASGGEGLDKAGGYGIQGSAGDFVERLEGQFDTVMGLPIELVERMIKRNGWQVAKNRSDEFKPAETSIAGRLNKVREIISSAARRSGRSKDSVQLIAVSKTKPIAMIEEAMRAGQFSFGENYVQEAVQKVESLPRADWHFIGSLQTNKVKQVVGRFSLIHSVDRLRLAEEISRQAMQLNIVQDVLVQVQIGDEATKRGSALSDASELIRAVIALPGVRVRGIMSLPPLTDDETLARKRFAELRDAFHRWRQECFVRVPTAPLASESPVHSQSDVFTELSMGTSSDFEWAILEGATMVRVGTSIFGERETRLES